MSTSRIGVCVSFGARRYPWSTRDLIRQPKLASVACVDASIARSAAAKLDGRALKCRLYACSVIVGWMAEIKFYSTRASLATLLFTRQSINANKVWFHLHLRVASPMLSPTCTCRARAEIRFDTQPCADQPTPTNQRHVQSQAAHAQTDALADRLTECTAAT